MATVKQKVTKRATNKNGANYTKKTTVSQKVTNSNDTQTKQFKYTRKITVNGKTRYYYA